MEQTKQIKDALRKEAVLLRAKKWHEDNREKSLARMRQRYAERKEEYKKKAKEWKAKNKEKHRASVKKWRDSNREKYLAKSREYYQKNKEKVVAAINRWNEQNPTARRIYKNIRKNRLRAAIHPGLDPALERFVFERAQALTELTGVQFVVDHIIPLSAGGWHHHDNLQPMMADDNSQKSDNPFWEDPSGEYLTWRDVPRELWPDGLAAEYEARLAVAA